MSTRHLLDTNILIRYLTNDHETHSPQALQLMRRAVDGELVLYLDSLVLAESVWVLQKVYEFPRNKIATTLMRLVEFEGIESPDKRSMTLALQLYEQHNVDYADAYLAAKAEIMGDIQVVTFNTKDFNKLGVNNCKPEEIE
ncbi:PIN domain-containing protein [Brevibacillus fluminis]|uniref:PIN domain-containing protein n=1 Tax=Brevibacillus fluminis TaxID=511487 RepID=UPI003F8A7440